LRRMAREGIRAGRLPAREPQRMWGGPGSGAVCSLCGQPVRQEEVEFELQFMADGPSTEETYHLHARCLTAWKSEREPSEQVREAVPSGETGPRLSASRGSDALSTASVGGIMTNHDDHPSHARGTS
jgi:hypothetical protein